MKKVIVLLPCIVISIVQAKLYTPDFQDQFYKYIKRHRLAIVHFNPFDSSEELKALGDMKMAFYNLSNAARYKDADVAFIGVNIQKTPELFKVYGIKTEVDEKDKVTQDAGAEQLDARSLPHEQHTTLMVFKDGRPYKIKGEMVKAEGFMNKSQIRAFIEDSVGELIDSIVQERQEELREQQRVQQAQQPAQVVQQKVVYEVPQVEYVPARYYYGRPYWGGGYYGGGYRRRGWYGPGVGVGFGFGGRRGGVGFGFGW